MVQPRPGMRMWLVAAVVALAACGSSATGSGSADPVNPPPSATAEAPAPAPTDPATPATGATTNPTPTTAGPAPSAADPTASPTTAGSDPGGVRHVFPASAKPASYGTTHHDYPATDIFTACGSTAVAPVDGVIVHWRTTDTYDPAVDNPALRGGLSAAILGDDGVRYYLSHFSRMRPELGVGSRVTAGQPLAAVGHTGNARDVACHIHFGLSPNCPAPEWSVRRGAIPPAPFLDAWRAGRNTSPAAVVQAWAAAHPGACTTAAANPFAADAG